MLININFESEKPIYIQLQEQIIAGIAKNEIVSGEMLPSVRRLASDIGINLHTVRKAYQHLQQEGYILIHRQKGVIVNPDGISEADDAYINQLTEILNPLIAESICKNVNNSDFIQICNDIYNDYQRQGGENK